MGLVEARKIRIASLLYAAIKQKILSKYQLQMADLKITKLYQME